MKEVNSIIVLDFFLEAISRPQSREGDPKQSTVVILNWYDRYQNSGLRWLEVARVLQRREWWRKRPPEICIRVLLSLCWTQDTHSQGKISQSQVLWGTVGTEMNTSQTPQRTETNQFPLRVDSHHQSYRNSGETSGGPCFTWGVNYFLD